MKKKTREALEKSRNKWFKIWKSPKAIDRGATNCALCTLFNVSGIYCKECPVEAKTSQCSCKGTPYTLWIYRPCGNSHKSWRSRGPRCKECLQRAYDELKFLDDLLPKKYRICKG